MNISPPEAGSKRPFYLWAPELTLLVLLTLLSYLVIAVFSNISDTGEFHGGLIILGMFGSFVFSVLIAIIAVLGGVGGGVIFTPIILGFTSVDTLIVRATGLVVAMFSGLISARLLMRRGLLDIKLVFFGAVPIILGSLSGAYSAVHMSHQFGETGDAFVRLILGLLILGIAGLFIISGKRSEYPVNENEGPLAKGLGLSGSYWDASLNRKVDYKIRRGRYGLLLLVLVGFVGGFFGLGGGWSVVPIFNLLMYVPLKLSAGCSGVLLALGNAAAIWPYIAAGALIPLFVAPWMLGQVIGGIIGAHILSVVRAGFVRILLIVLLLLTSLKLIVRGLEGVFMFQFPLL